MSGPVYILVKWVICKDKPPTGHIVQINGPATEGQLSNTSNLKESLKIILKQAPIYG